ncbi:MAG: glutathione peroxidase [Kiloniellales bacterium]|nr:glutathione peroxidase [Kiloniellales bacterium]
MRHLLFAITLLASLPLGAQGEERPSPDARGAHAFGFTAIEGDPLPLERFAGKAVLVVNTASRCGFTRQYGDLQALWERFRDRGLVVLAVPSNDFGGQEPGSEAEIKEFCEVNFSVDFPMTEKVRVTGAQAHPFYRWAEVTLGPGTAPRWNFHKYLVAPDGRLVAWFPTRTRPDAEAVIQAIEAHLPGAPGASG